MDELCKLKEDNQKQWDKKTNDNDWGYHAGRQETLGEIIDMVSLRITCMEDIKIQKIVMTKGICGGSARLNGTRIPVWGLEEARREGYSNAEILEMYPMIQQSSLQLAWNYVEKNIREISQEIDEN